MRILTTLCVASALLATAICAAQPGAAKPRPELILEDFEGGVGDWTTNDDEAEQRGAVTKAAIYAVSGGCPQGGSQSARMEFARSMKGWASISLPVEGKDWAAKGCSTVCFWLKGDGSGEAVRVVLRVRTERPATDIAYSQVIKLEGTEWEHFSLRWFGFKDSANNVMPLADIRNVKLLQFAKNGGWGSFRFRIDRISVQAEEDAPIPAPAPAPAPPPSPQFTGQSLGYAPDFSRTGPYSLVQTGLCMGRPPVIVDSEDDRIISWAYALVSDLGPCVVRLEMDGYFNEDRETYDLEALMRHLEWIRKCNCKPLICVDVPEAPVGDERARRRLFEVFVKAVRDLASRTAKSKLPVYFEVFDQPLISGTFDDMAHVCTAYDSITKLILAAHPAAKVGGPGLASAWDSQVIQFLKTVTRVDFLSFHFYGTHSPTTSSDALFGAARTTLAVDLPHQIGFSDVRRLAKQYRKIPPEIFVTEFALSSSVDDQGDARDERSGTAFGAAWLAAALMNGGPYVDKVLHYQFRPGGWGTVSLTGNPETPYWGAWLLRTFAPRGSVRQSISLIGDMTVAAVFKTRSAHNIIIAHASPEALELRISPKNAPKLKAVRYRKIEDADEEWRGGDLPARADQTILLQGAGVTVLQYVPASATGN